MKPGLVRALWAGLVVAAGFTTWLFFARPTPSPGPRAAPGAKEKPDYTLHDAVSTRYDAAGMPRYKLVSASIAHMPAAGVSLLRTVTFHYYADSGTAWQLVADRGTLSSDGARLELAGDVRGHELDRTDPVHFATSEATVEFEQRLVLSNARAKIWKTGYALAGTGLQADLRSGRLELLHDVTGRYVP